MKNLNKLFFLFMLTLVFAGCKKEKDTEPTKEQIISGKNWKLTSIRATTALSPTTPVEAIGYLPTCQTDNFLRFETNGKVTNDEGASKCPPNTQQTKEGNYSINNNVLTLEGAILSSFGVTSTSSKNLIIDELTEQTLKVTLNETINFQGVPVPITSATITFTPQ